ncbi:MAG: hypothetical protein KME64_17355 [Scytonematopsis contorta HA4267-MV1]|jgi:hypothetical protein|nr:hypothetical protein [Scytonematopsis contorta HA4267-MV1]
MSGLGGDMEQKNQNNAKGWQTQVNNDATANIAETIENKSIVIEKDAVKTSVKTPLSLPNK